MNILLINPSLKGAEIGHYKREIEKSRGVYPSLGLSYVASALLSAGHNVILFDWDATPQPEKSLVKVIKELKPKLVGFYLMTWTFRQAKDMLKIIKEFSPDIKSVVGGPNVHSFPVISLKFSDFDFAIQGEGEYTILELIDHLEGEKDAASIRGLIWRGGDIIQNSSRPFIEDLDKINFPAWDKLPYKNYYDVFTQNRHFATLIATRGCPWDCTFCDRKNRMGSIWRKRSTDNIIKELKWLRDSFNIREFMFFDDNLVVDKNWVMEFCDKIVSNNLDIDWECRARVDMVDRPLLNTMKKAGCYRIRYGMEAGDNRILKVLKKGISVEQIRDCAHISKEAGIEIFAYFMMGSPYETEETLNKTLELALEVDADFTLFSKTILIVGSELFEWAVENGYIKKNYWLDYLLGKENNPAPALSTKELPEKVVDRYISMANQKFYLRPKYIFHRLTKIKKPSQFCRQLQMARAFLK